MEKWGGAIKKWYQTEPAIPPDTIPAAIAEDRGDPHGAVKERARAFLKRNN
jgi:hypothetical protein